MTRLERLLLGTVVMLLMSHLWREAYPFQQLDQDQDLPQEVFLAPPPNVEDQRFTDLIAARPIEFPPRRGWVWVIPNRIVDGDTATFSLLVDLGRCRLTGISAPERGKLGYQEATEELGRKMPEFTGPYLGFLGGLGGFGRPLIEVFRMNGSSINRELLNTPYFNPYIGGAKLIPTDFTGTSDPEERNP